MPTAIVTGATGITGHAIVQRLLASPQWTSITALSRSKQPSPHSKLTHLTIDLQSDAESMTNSLSSIASVDYVFFCAYLADSDEAEAVRINGAMLRNFITALRSTGAIRTLKRIILVNGLKQYGVHLGQPKQPMHESDPRLEGEPWPPNFYYEQQDILISESNQDSNRWSWVVTYPQDVIGVAKSNFMNLATALGLYASVSAQLPSKEIPFPGAKAAYLAFNSWTSADLHAEFCEWAALEPQAGNQAFNVVNGDVESWQNLWPKLVDWFGGKLPPVMFPPDGYRDFESWNFVHPSIPPIAVHEQRIGLQGDYTEKHNLFYQQIDTVKWAERPEVTSTWRSLRDKHGLHQETWDNATWRFISVLLGREFSCVVSMSKARKLGWTGYVDTWDAFEDTFKKLEKERILPGRSS